MERTVQVTSGVRVRPMEVEDIDGVLDIDRRTTGLNRATTYRDQIDSYLGGDLALSYVAELDGRVVGFVLGRIRDLRHGIYEGAWIEMIGVAPDCKRQGIGRVLLDGFFGGCRERALMKSTSCSARLTRN